RLAFNQGFDGPGRLSAAPHQIPVESFCRARTREAARSRREGHASANARNRGLAGFYQKISGLALPAIRRFAAEQAASGRIREKLHAGSLARELASIDQA